MAVSTVQQAVDLLAEGLAAAQQKRAVLAVEMSSIDEEIEAITDAVRRLTGLPAPEPVISSPHAQHQPGSIRAAVKQILDSEPVPFTTSTLRHMLPIYLTEGKTSEQISNSVRSALWSLRQSNEAIMVAGNEGTVSVKHPGFLAANDPTASPAESDQDDLPGPGGGAS